MQAYVDYTDGRDSNVRLRLPARFGTGRTTFLITTSALHALRVVEAVNGQPGTNSPAVMAALEARGPRCDRCNGWTFRPAYRHVDKAVTRLCPDCWLPPLLRTPQPEYTVQAVLGCGGHR